MKKMKPTTIDAASQKQRFIEAAREAGADMGKDEFARVIHGLAKPENDTDQGPRAEGKDDA